MPIYLHTYPSPRSTRTCVPPRPWRPCPSSATTTGTRKAPTTRIRRGRPRACVRSVFKSSCGRCSSRPWGFELLHAYMSFDKCWFTVDLRRVWIWDLRPSDCAKLRRTACFVGVETKRNNEFHTLPRGLVLVLLSLSG